MSGRFTTQMPHSAKPRKASRPAMRLGVLDSAINYPLWSWCMTRWCMVYIMTIVTTIAPTTT